METNDKKPSAMEGAGYIAGTGYGITRSLLAGKPISASIIVLASAVLIVGGSHVQHGDTRLFVQIVGCIVGVIGLAGWLVSFREK